MRTQSEITLRKSLQALLLDTEDIQVELANGDLTAFKNNPNVRYRGHSRLLNKATVPTPLEMMLAEDGGEG